jgi:predicted Zn-dependent peptidase
MPDTSLQQTREQLTQALSQISSLSSDNARLKARLTQLKNVDPERIIKLAEQVTAELKRSEERSDQLLRVIGELRDRNKKLEDLVIAQQSLIEDFQTKLQTSLDENAGLEGSDGGDSDLQDGENMEMVKSKIAALTESVTSVQSLLANLHQTPRPSRTTQEEQDKKTVPSKNTHELLIKELLDSL